MPSGQELIDLLAQGISPTGASVPAYSVDEAVLRRYLEPETAAVAAQATLDGPMSPHFRVDRGQMTVGANVIPTVVMIAADGVPRYADPQYSFVRVPAGGSLTLGGSNSNGMILIAIGGKGSPGAEGGQAEVAGGGDSLCIALGGEGGQGLKGAALPILGGVPQTGGNGSDGGRATVKGGDGSDLYAFAGDGGQGGTGSRGSDLFVQMSTMALTPNPSNSPILSVPSAGGKGGVGGGGGFAQCAGGDASYVRAAAGDGGAPGEGGPGGKGGTAYAGTNSAMTYGDGGQGQGGTGGAGGDTHAVTGANGRREEVPGKGGKPTNTSGPGAKPGPDGSQL